MRMSIKTALPKLLRYLRELTLCYRLGADSRSRWGLMRATVLFHFSHGWATRNRTSAQERCVYRLRIGDRVVPVTLRTYGGDFFVLHEVFLGECYRIPDRWLQRHQVQTIVDLGAHVGLTSLFFLRDFSHARFVCVEANPENSGLLQHNLGCLENRVHIFPGAVSDISGPVIFVTDGPTWSGRVSTQDNGGAAIRGYAMEEILASSNVTTIDILKVDIEGAEQQLFRRAADWLRKVRIIIIELHDGYTLEHFALDVAPHGFTVVSPDPTLGNQMVCAIAGDV
jgi:FkbM family methyltransferase